MKVYMKYLVALVLLPALVLVSCKKETTETEFEKLTTYMQDNELDLSDVLNGWVTSAGGINVDQTDYSVPDYYVIDIRSQADYDAGHIKDAHHSSLVNILDEAANANGKNILVVCYSGQTAARAVGALKMMGFPAKSLKWGMSSWHSNFAGKWDAKAGDNPHANWVSSGTPPANVEFDDPSISTGMLDGKDILEARVKAMLENDWAISNADVLGDPSAYFINNKWPQASWDEYGHIDGAYRIDEDLLFSGLKNLDPNKTVVTYCYTGQTSAITSAWLNVMGFESRSLLYGANAIVHTKLLNGTAGDAPKKSWKGAGSGSVNNFGYYNTAGDYFAPE